VSTLVLASVLALVQELEQLAMSPNPLLQATQQERY
jgi:hypothetical protein